MFASLHEPALPEASQSQSPPGGGGGGGVARQFRLAEKALGGLVGRLEFAAHKQRGPSREMHLHALGDIVAQGCKPSSLREDRLRLLGGMTFRPSHRLAIA